MNKEQRYEIALKEVKSVIEAGNHLLSNMANFCAILQFQFHHHWVGFYLVDEPKQELYLGTFQGPLACTKIPFGKGVCGSTWEQGKSIIVDDVHQFPGHIACSSATNSEIVVPVKVKNKVVAVLDIDSIAFKNFDQTDQQILEEMVEHLIAQHSIEDFEKLK